MRWLLATHSNDHPTYRGGINSNSNGIFRRQDGGGRCGGVELSYLSISLPPIPPEPSAAQA